MRIFLCFDLLAKRFLVFNFIVVLSVFLVARLDIVLKNKNMWEPRSGIFRSTCCSNRLECGGGYDSLRGVRGMGILPISSGIKSANEKLYVITQIKTQICGFFLVDHTKPS